MKKKALNLTLHPGIRHLAAKIMRRRHYGSLSTLVEELIRERYDQVFGTDNLLKEATNEIISSRPPKDAASSEASRGPESPPPTGSSHPPAQGDPPRSASLFAGATKPAKGSDIPPPPHCARGKT